MESRRLIIMRHATADSDGHRDHARSLTAQGSKEATRAGQLLRSLGALPQRVLSSSAIRCRETWERVSAAMDEPVIVDFDDALYNASAESLVDVVIEADDDERTLLLLAHNPGVSMLALELARDDDEGRHRLSAGFTPASIACFAVEGSWSSLSCRSARLTHFERTSKP